MSALPEEVIAKVEAGDPDRFLAAMAAPVEARLPLLTLAAFNLEVARAAWASKEAMIARMRLQFWHDAVDRLDAPLAHELCAPLAALIRARDLPVAAFHRIIEAREADLEHRPFTTTAALWDYLEATAGELLGLSVTALGGQAQPAHLQLGAAQGLANYLMAVPALEAAHRHPLPDESPEAIAALATEGLERHSRALRALGRPRSPALLAVWRAKPLLAQVARAPQDVLAGGLSQSEFARKGSLLWRSLTGF